MALSNYAGGDDFLLTGFYNNLKQDFYRGQQAQAQQRAAEQKAAQERAKEINGLVNKINPDGLRSFDIPGFYKRYDEIVGLSAKAKNAENGVERAQAFADMQRAIQDTNLYVNSSKEYSQNLLNGASSLIKKPEDFTPDSNSYYKTMFSKPIDSLKGEALDISRFIKRPDQNIFEKDVDDIFKRAGTTQDVKLGGTLYDNNGNKILKTRTTTSANPQEVAQRLLDFASTDSNARRSLAERYPQLPTIEQQVGQFMADNETRLRETKVGTLSSSKGSNGSGDSDDDNLVFSAPLRKIFAGEGNKSKTTITSDKFQAFNGGNISLPQMGKVFNVNTQENESNVAFKGATVTGVGYFPQVGKKDKILMVSVSDADGQEYLVPEDKVPFDFKSKKLYKKAVGSLGTESPKAPKKQPTKTTSGYKAGQIVNGYKFKGGDPTKESNWTKI